jgi:hypothetical protein
MPVRAPLPLAITPRLCGDEVDISGLRMEINC